MTAVLAVLGAIGSIIGIVAYIDARASKRVKRLVWESTRAVPLAAAAPGESDYKLSILYERHGVEPEVIDSADVTYVRFANLGKEPIRRGDIAQANLFRLEVQYTADGRGRPLDVALAASTREVIQLSVGVLEHSATTASANVEFDFLDFGDGGLLRLLTNGLPDAVRMEGDIVGMPEGLQEWDSLQPSSSEVKGWGLAGWALTELVAFVGLGLLFHEITGRWTGVWLLLLPPIVFVAVLILCLMLAEGPSTYRRRRLKFPRSLEPKQIGFAMIGPDGEYLFRRPRAPAKRIGPSQVDPSVEPS